MPKTTSHLRLRPQTPTGQTLLTGFFGVASLLAGIWVGCNREEPVPTMSRPVDISQPTSQMDRDEKKAKILENLEPIPLLGAAKPQKMRDGEIWQRYDNGLLILDYKPSYGAIPQYGQTVHVRYVGTFPDGKEFDRSGTEPFQFPLGTKNIIKGWNIGIANMHVGGKRKLWIPASLAYGARGAPGKIPPNQALIFDIELVKVTGDIVEMPPASEPSTLKLDMQAGPAVPSPESKPAK